MFDSLDKVKLWLFLRSVCFSKLRASRGSFPQNVKQRPWVESVITSGRTELGVFNGCVKGMNM